MDAARTTLRYQAVLPFADLVNWDEDADPYEGQRVLLADGGSQRLEALITAIRADGTVVLSVPAYAKPLRVTG